MRHSLAAALLLSLTTLTACDKLGNGSAAMMPASPSAVVAEASSAPAQAPTTFTVTLESRTDGPSPLSPGLYIVHRDGMPLFTTGMTDRGLGLESIAEDADPANLAKALPGSVIFNTPVGDTMPGPATPGKKFEFSFTASPGDRLSLMTMFGQSNDGFYAPADGGLALFNGNMPVTGDVTSQVPLWDAGTEVNQRPGNGIDQAARQPMPGLGTPEKLPVVTMNDRMDGYTYGQALKITIAAR